MHSIYSRHSTFSRHSTSSRHSTLSRHSTFSRHSTLSRHSTFSRRSTFSMHSRHSTASEHSMSSRQVSPHRNSMTQNLPLVCLLLKCRLGSDRIWWILPAGSPITRSCRQVLHSVDQTHWLALLLLLICMLIRLALQECVLQPCC